MAVTVGINGTRTVLMFTVMAIFALTFSLVISPVSAYAEEITPGKLIKAQKTLLPTFGSASQKVCGVTLCGQMVESQHVFNITSIRELGYNDVEKQASFDQALENPVALSILKSYFAYKHTEYVLSPIESQESDISLSRPTNPFANPDYTEPKTSMSSFRESIEPIPYVVKIPHWIKSSYANPDFPTVDKPEIVEDDSLMDQSIMDEISVEITEEIPIVTTNSTE